MHDLLHIFRCRWYHGRISREQAEALLQHKEDGMFLVRDSVHFAGDYTLSVCFDDHIDHYRIIITNNQLEVDGGDCSFNNLFELVEVGRVGGCHMTLLSLLSVMHGFAC